MNAVIVGDDKQLPNVINKEEEQIITSIQKEINVDDCYNPLKYSFLQSCTKIFKDAPTTLLREHYRCHPKIINFCNHRFYAGELVAMTMDRGEEDVLRVIKTVKGNHARDKFNQREIDVIIKEVIPIYKGKGSIGIITPYRDQAQRINEAVGQDIASTVHKYQGRECDIIIMSTVDNQPTDFSDNSNLLNVAISRAKKHLCIVTSGNKVDENTNLYHLINYIKYNNFEIKESLIHSVFDLLYKQYTKERLLYQSKIYKVSNHMSENLIYTTLINSIRELELVGVSVVCHYPMLKLIANPYLLEDKEKLFVESPFAHVDFLIYNSFTKYPLFTIEVDGWFFHNKKISQQYRDSLKDQILNKYGLKPYRISTTDTITKESMKQVLKSRINIVQT